MEGLADSPDPAGVGLKLTADNHIAAEGLIACLSSKGQICGTLHSTAVDSVGRTVQSLASDSGLI